MLPVIRKITLPGGKQIPVIREDAFRRAIKAAGEAYRKVRCVNAHDRCYGGAGEPCPYCEPVTDQKSD